ncbi:MAG: fimbria/pilus outer membrane usher protein [Candidatus Methylomirabilales bacterium]
MVSRPTRPRFPSPPISAKSSSHPVSLLLLILCTLLVVVSPAYATEQRALLTLLINTQERGEIPVILRDNDVLVRLQDLDQARLHITGGTQTLRGPDRYISLQSLAPEVEYAFNEEALSLAITAPAAFFTPTIARLSAARPENYRISTDTSAYLNYAIRSDDLQIPEGFVESALSFRGKYLLSTTASQTTRYGPMRGLTAFNYEDHEALTRWTAGDTFFSTTQLGSGGTFGGLTYSREFGQDPYVFHRPDHILTGSTLTPSTARVYVNGILLRDVSLAPGPFELRNLPIPSGARDVRLVVRDAFGRETDVSSFTYVVPSLLSQGLHEFHYHLGASRNSQDAQYPWGTYANPGFLGAHRYGVTDDLTAGGRLELDSRTISAGPNFSLATPWGQFDTEIAASLQTGLPGWAASANYAYSAPRFAFGINTQFMSPQYATISVPASQDRLTVTAGPFVSYQLSPSIDLSLDYIHTHNRDSGPSDMLRLTSSIHLATNLGLLLTGSLLQPAQGRPDFQLGFTLYYTFGNSKNASLSSQQSRSGNTTTATVSKSLPVGEGYGYRISSNSTKANTQSSPSTSALPLSNGLFQYQGRYGRADAKISNDQTGVIHNSLTFAGSIAAINGHVLVGRPIQDGFGIVRLEDLPNVHVTVDNAPIGTTNSHGSLLIPNLLPYYANNVAIMTEDVPVDRMMETITTLASPPLHGGALIEFHAPIIRAIRGRIHPTDPEAPAYLGPGLLSLTVNGQSYESSLGHHGEFYLENVPPGDQTASVHLPNLACHVTLHVTQTDAPLIDLGELPCASEP